MWDDAWPLPHHMGCGVPHVVRELGFDKLRENSACSSGRRGRNDPPHLLWHWSFQSSHLTTFREAFYSEQLVILDVHCLGEKGSSLRKILDMQRATRGGQCPVSPWLYGVLLEGHM